MNMNSENIDNQLNGHAEEISLKELILKIKQWCNYLISKWLIILVLGLIGGGLGFLYAYKKKVVYIATTTFVLEDEKGSNGLSGLAGLASIAGVDLGGSAGGIFQGDNILGLYKSRSILERTLLTPVEGKDKKQSLIDWYIEFNQLRKKWVDRPELFNIKFLDDSLQNDISPLKRNRLRDSVLGVVITDINKNYLSVAKPDKKLSTIQVDVKAPDEFFAKVFNDELVKNVNEFYVSTKTRKTLQNVKILQYKTDSVKAVMNGAIYSAAAVADATPNLNPTRQVQRIAPVQRAQFSAETNKAMLSEMAKSLEMTKIALLKETPLIQVIDQPIYPLPKEKFGKMKGTIIGSVLFCFLTILFIISRKVFKTILS
jgi:hypothetical protein